MHNTDIYINTYVHNINGDDWYSISTAGNIIRTSTEVGWFSGKEKTVTNAYPIEKFRSDVQNLIDNACINTYTISSSEPYILFARLSLVGGIIGDTGHAYSFSGPNDKISIESSVKEFFVTAIANNGIYSLR